MDQFKGRSIEEISAELDLKGSRLEIAIENLERDFNMGTIVRTANAFGVRHVHVIGRKQWNKRGAMMTDKYLHVHYHATIEDFLHEIGDKQLVAIDNLPGARVLSKTQFRDDCVMVFGSEGAGISAELAARAELVVAIEQFGSTRSLNVGVAAGVAMYAWVRENVLSQNAK